MSMNRENNNRIVIIRIIAILSVVICHVAEVVYGKGTDWNSIKFSKLSLMSRQVLITCYLLGRCFGPPLFIMISGYLFLDRKWDFDKITAFYKKNWGHLLACTVIWFLIYDTILALFFKVDLPIPIIIKDILMMNKVQMMNVWYMPMILGLYPLIPFVSVALQKIEVKWLIRVFIFYSILVVVIPTINTILYTMKLPLLNSQINYGFSGGSYGLYLVAGYLIKKKTQSGKLALRLIIGVLIFVLCAIFVNWRISNKDYSGIWCDNVFVFLSSIMIFSALVDCKIFDKKLPITDFLSKYSFAVYLIHVIVLKGLYSVFATLPLKLPVIVCLLFLTVVTISYIMSWFISKIPKVGNYLLYIK